MAGSSSLPGEQWNKKESVTVLLLAFPHHARETTTSQETSMPQDTITQPLLTYRKKFLPLPDGHRHQFHGDVLQGIPQAALPPPDPLSWVRFPKMQPCP